MDIKDLLLQEGDLTSRAMANAQETIIGAILSNGLDREAIEKELNESIGPLALDWTIPLIRLGKTWLNQ